MKKLLLLFVLMVCSTAFAQKMKVVSGDFNFLKNEQKINVVLKFDNVLFMKENYSEQQYLERRKKDVIENPKRGEDGWRKWSGEWENYKNEEYINYLLKGLNKNSKKIEFVKDPAAKYTVLMETKWIFPGWHGGMVGMTAEISGTVKFVETDNPSVILAEIELDKFDNFVKNKEFVMEYGRIAAAYESIGRFLVKEIKKTN